MKIADFQQELSDCRKRGFNPVVVRMGHRDWHELASEAMALAGGDLKLADVNIRYPTLAGVVVDIYESEEVAFLSRSDIDREDYAATEEQEQAILDLLRAEAKKRHAEGLTTACIGMRWRE